MFPERLLWMQSVRAVICLDATAGVRMLAEVLEGEWREIRETTTRGKTCDATFVNGLS